MRKPAQFVLADNLKRAYEYARDQGKFTSLRDLARQAKVAPQTVIWMMEPDKRSAGPDSSPKLDRAEAVARTLGRELWELLLPNFNPHENYATVTRTQYNAFRILKESAKALPELNTAK